MCSSYGGQKGALNSLKLELKVVWTTRHGVGNQLRSSAKAASVLKSWAISLVPVLLYFFLKCSWPSISSGSTSTGVSNQELKKISQKNAACLLNEETSMHTAHALWQGLETAQRWSNVPWVWQWAMCKSQDILSKGPHHLWTGEYITGGGVALNPLPTDMRDVCIFSVALRSEVT